MWILGSAQRDFAFILAPGLVALLLTPLVGDAGVVFGVWAFLCAGVIDSGHVYLTIWRTWLHPAGRTRWWFWMVPVGVAATVTAWARWDMRYLWTMVIYATFFHHVRQYYGVLRWYERLSSGPRWWAEGALYLLTGLPVLAYHFRPDAIDGFYVPGELWLYRSPASFLNVQLLWGAVALAWLAAEARHWGKHPREGARLLSIAIPSVVHFVALGYGRTPSEILFPLLVAHGVPYFALMGWSLRRTQAQRFSSRTKVAILLGVTAVVLGGLEGGLEHFGLDSVFVGQGRLPWIPALICGVYLVPLLSHFIFDAFLWRRNYREPSSEPGPAAS